MSHMTAKLPKAVRDYLRDIGARGGRVSSPAKTEAVRENAKKPRPNRRKNPAARPHAQPVRVKS